MLKRCLFSALTPPSVLICTHTGPPTYPPSLLCVSPPRVSTRRTTCPTYHSPSPSQIMEAPGKQQFLTFLLTVVIPRAWNGVVGTQETVIKQPNDSNLDGPTQTQQVLALAGWGGPKGKGRSRDLHPASAGGQEGQGLACSPKVPYLTLQGVSSLGPGHLQVLRQRRELVAPRPVVVIAG